jgi:hypothetical protein
VANTDSSSRSSWSGGGSLRTGFLTAQADYYRNLLHPGLAKFTPLIAELAHQIRPEWQFLKPEPPADHLHEAFHRILLKWIIDPNTSGMPVQSKKRLLEDPCPDHSLSIAQSKTSSYIPVDSHYSEGQSKRRKQT